MASSAAGWLERLVWLCALGVALTLVPSCTERDTGERAGARVVSLSPNTTETIFALGAGDQLVGRSRYCDFPPAARRLPAVGGFADPSVEAIIGLNPTLVVGSRSPAGPSLAEALAARGIVSYFPATDSVAAIEAMVRGLAGRLGRPEQGRALAHRIETQVRHIADNAPRAEPVRAVLLFDDSPIVVAGPGGFPDELLRLAGGRNVIDRGGPYPTVNLERLLALDPDVVIDASEVGAGGAAHPGNGSTLADRPGWRELRAVRNDRVRALTSDAALRPGPRIAEGLAEIYALLHGRAPEP